MIPDVIIAFGRRTDYEKAVVALHRRALKLTLRSSAPCRNQPHPVLTLSGTCDWTGETAALASHSWPGLTPSRKSARFLVAFLTVLG